LRRRRRSRSDDDARQDRGKRLADEKLFPAYGRREHRLERSLLAFADDRAAGDDRRQQQRHQEERQAGAADGGRDGSGCRPGGHGEHARKRKDDEDDRQHGHRADHELVPTILAQLLAEDRSNARVHRATSTSSFTSWR
jgi:hypothetical protein